MIPLESFATNPFTRRCMWVFESNNPLNGRFFISGNRIRLENGLPRRESCYRQLLFLLKLLLVQIWVMVQLLCRDSNLNCLRAFLPTVIVILRYIKILNIENSKLSWKQWKEFWYAAWNNFWRKYYGDNDYYSIINHQASFYKLKSSMMIHCEAMYMLLFSSLPMYL